MSKDSTSLIKETLVCMRKNLSQEQVNRKLKSKTNQVARWESGHAAIDWASFCDFAAATKTPLATALRKYVYYMGDSRDEKALVHFLTNFHKQKDLAAKLKVSRSYVSRLIAGKAALDLATLFALIDLSSSSLVDFVAALTFPQVPASVKVLQERLSKEKQLHYEKPWVAALILFICTTDYTNLSKHSDKFLALKLGVPEAEVHEALQTLEEIEVLEKRGPLYFPNNIHLNTTGSYEGNMKLRRHWMDRSRQELDKLRPGTPGYFGYKVFNIHSAELPELKEFYLRMYAELNALIAKAPRQPDKVFLFSFNMMDLDASKKIPE
jgi:transcriptional regulator with XRE-family HTH domain